MSAPVSKIDIEAIKKDLDSMQKQIAEADKNVAVCDGRIQESLQSLLGLGLENEKAGDAEVERLTQKLASLEIAAKKQFDELQEGYQW